MIGIRKIIAVCIVGLFATFSSAATAQELVVRYAAQDYKGAPKFKVSGYQNGSNRSVWNSPVITAVGGVDTERFGGNQSRLKWQNAKVPCFKILYMCLGQIQIFAGKGDKLVPKIFGRIGRMCL